ncbi:MAG: DHA2 family efflux MFS transporter permease subunit [Bacteroidales bacterium]|nr:DHA2 family efflux MFS transporter permease subunit [Bacteroidales bacterium]
MKKRKTVAHRIRKVTRSRDSVFHPQSDNYKWWLLANVMIGTFMAVLDATIVNVGLPKIMASFGVGLDKIEWVITAYMLAMAVMLPTSGWLADKFGYKRMYFLGLLVFTFGSLLCGLSGDENTLIIARIIQGLGAGTIQPLGMAIISREFPPHQRGIALGFWAISAAASVSFGPLIGGYLVDNFSWPLIFYVNIPIGIIGLLATIIIQGEYKNKRIRKFDYIGFISVIIFLPLMLFALTEGNAATNSEGWSAPYILICFAISIIALAVFITTELTTSEPLIDLRLLRNHNFGICMLILLIFSIGMFGSTFLMPIYLQNSLGYTALQAGAVFLPVGIIQGIMSPISGIISDKINAKVPMILGVVLLALSFWVNTKLSYLTEHSYIMISLYLRGLSLGLIFTPLTTISLVEVPREKLAQASGLSNTLRQLGGSLGVALLATMLTSRINYHAEMYSESVQPHSQIYQNTISHLSNSIQHNAGSAPAIASKQSQVAIASFIGKQAYIQGVDDDFMLAAIITFIGGIPIIFLHTKKKK